MTDATPRGDGYLRIPRRFLCSLNRSGRTLSREEAALWLVEKASFAEREVAGLTLAVGETPPYSLSELEREWRWSRKAVRLALAYFASPECTEVWGLSIKPCRKMQGHSEGHSQGHTYRVAVTKVRTGEGHSEGHSQGHSVKKEVENNSPPTGESAERGNRLKPAKVRRTPVPMTDDWKPSADTVRLAEALHVNLAPFLLDFRGYWMDRGTRRADWDATCRARIEACASAGKFLLNGNGNGSHRPAQADLLSTDAMKRLAEREAGEVPPYDPSQRWKTATK